MNQCAIQQSCVIRSREEQQQQRIRRSSITTTSMIFSVDDHNLNRPTMNNLVCPKPRRVSLLNGTLNNNININDSRSRALPWPHIHHQTEISEKAGSELLNLILSRGGGEAGGGINSTHNTTVQVAVAVSSSSSSPGPFFIGSPPGRVSNPLTKDAVFKEPGSNNNNVANNNNFLNFSLTNNTNRHSSTTPVCGRRGGGGSGGSPDGSAASSTFTSSNSSTSPSAPTPNYYSPNPAGGGAREGSGCVREHFGNNPAVRIEGFDCLDRDNSRRNSCSIATLA